MSGAESSPGQEGREAVRRVSSSRQPTALHWSLSLPGQPKSGRPAHFPRHRGSGNPLCTGTWLQGPGLGHLLPGLSHRTVTWGSPYLWCPSLWGARFLGAKDIWESGGAPVALLARAGVQGAGGGGAGVRAQPPLALWDRVGAQLCLTRPSCLFSALASLRGHGLLLLPHSQGSVPGSPPSCLGHRAQHLPRRQEAPREAWLVIRVATWPPRVASLGMGQG